MKRLALGFLACAGLVLLLAFSTGQTVVAGKAPASEKQAAGATAVGIFAGGCFWCMEHAFDDVDGVISTTSGYIGGRTKTPTYKQVSRGGTGHAEAVNLQFKNAVSEDEATKALRAAPGVTVVDHRQDEGYVTPQESAGEDPVYVSRIRKDPTLFAGTVEEVGSADTGYEPGDRVFATHHVPCNECSRCRSGHPSTCETLRTTRFDPGGFAEFVRVPSLQVSRGMLRLPDDVTFDQGSFIEPHPVPRPIPMLSLLWKEGGWRTVSILSPMEGHRGGAGVFPRLDGDRVSHHFGC